MKRIRNIISVAAVLLVALTTGSCVHPLVDEDYAELMVSLYIPDIVPTKAVSGSLNPNNDEKAIVSLKIWVFLPDGTLVRFKSLTTGSETEPFDPSETGLGHSTITRFGLPLTPEMFAVLSASGAKADVYAIANADESWGLTGLTTRDQLDEIVLTGDVYGGTTGHLTMSVPQTGLPMAGVIKNAPVSGGYPVLNISTLTLTRLVSKIRFVFIQQASETNSAQPFNTNCVIKKIEFDGTANSGSQISDKEFIFTQERYGETDQVFSIDGYTPLSAEISKADGPLISNGSMACAEDPVLFTFGSPGHEMESAQEYENRIDAAIDGLASQVGPIYIRETDKPISGTIWYRTTPEGDGPDKQARFSMETGEVMTRNHSWVVFGYFAEETGTLQLTVKVLPWTWTTHMLDYTTDAVNVVRRFTANETIPSTFKKVQTLDGFYDVSFWHTVDNQENVIVGDIIIATPVLGEIYAVPVPGANTGVTRIDDAIIVSPVSSVIYPPEPDPATGTVEACRIEFRIQRNPKYADTQLYAEDYLDGQYIDLHFYVDYQGREIDLGSESIDYYRFILDKNWDK